MRLRYRSHLHSSGTRTRTTYGPRERGHGTATGVNPNRSPHAEREPIMSSPPPPPPPHTATHDLDLLEDRGGGAADPRSIHWDDHTRPTSVTSEPSRGPRHWLASFGVRAHHDPTSYASAAGGTTNETSSSSSKTHSTSAPEIAPRSGTTARRPAIRSGSR